MTADLDANDGLKPALAWQPRDGRGNAAGTDTAPAPTGHPSVLPNPQSAREPETTAQALWPHFGSSEAVNAALRGLVEAAKQMRRTGS